MPAVIRSNSGKESQPLLPRSPSAGPSSTPTVVAHDSTRRASPRFLGLFLWQWGLVALAALCLYGVYLVGAALAWKHGGKRYHVVVLTVGCLSAVRSSFPSVVAPHGSCLRVPTSHTCDTVFHNQAWCLVQIAHTLCCPGLMFTNIDTEGGRESGSASSSAASLAAAGSSADAPTNRV
jgi:hypothetical protein